MWMVCQVAAVHPPSLLLVGGAQELEMSGGACSCDGKGHS